MDISDLRLRTHDLERVRGFYVDTLGMGIIDESDDMIVLDAGATRLIFQQDEDETPYQYHFAFNIPNNQFTDAKAWLSFRTELLHFEGRDEINWTSWNAKALYFRDPVGNIVELIARFNVDNDSEIPFSAQSIRRVSEIGLGVKKPDEIAELLKRELDIPLWDEGSDIFTACGDEHGLLILVKLGRAWFPTSDVQAKKAPVHMTIRGDRDAELEIPKTDYVIKMVAT